MQRKAIIITIGDELLIGQVIDTNSAWMAAKLNEIGISVLERVAVGDEKNAMVEALKTAMGKADLVLLTGGLGPTSDDLTKPVLCEFFDAHLVTHEPTLLQLQEMFAKRSRPMLPANARQADVPHNCTVIPNVLGTAPGMLFERNHVLVASFPGVPFEMKAMMTDWLLPKLRTYFPDSDHIVHKTILTYGEGESFLAERIKDIEAALPEQIGLAYLPAPFSVRLRLTASGSDANELENELSLWQQKIAERLSDKVVSLEDTPLELILARQLREKQLTLGLAESCTGGYIGHKFTKNPGATTFFKGAVVCYATEIKTTVLGIDKSLIETHGVVSAPVAEAMATAARKTLNADIGLGITGILSEGAYEDKSPVGTVYVSIALPDGNVVTTPFFVRHNRAQNIENACSMALYRLWAAIQTI